MKIEDIVMNTYSTILEHNTSWLIDGVLRRPVYEDVELVVTRLIDAVTKNNDSISIETGGVLTKRTDNHIDVYVRIGRL